MGDKPDDVPSLEEIGDGDDLPGYWTERTTITVRRYTKERLDDDRDGQPWDDYLESLRRSKADPLTLTDAEEIADALTHELDLTTDELDLMVSADDIAEQLKAEIDALAFQGGVTDEEAERIVGRIDDLEAELPRKVAEELQR